MEETIGRLDNSSENRFEPLKSTISLLTVVKDNFIEGDEGGKRALVNMLGLNPQIADRKLLITAKKPFAMIAENTQIPTRRRGWDSNPRNQ